jgi:hypothetical protein
MDSGGVEDADHITNLEIVTSYKNSKIHRSIELACCLILNANSFHLGTHLL